MDNTDRKWQAYNLQKEWSENPRWRGIKRDYTAEEISEVEMAQKEASQAALVMAETAAKKSDILKKLGITEEEAKLLFS